MAWEKIGENSREEPNTYSCKSTDTKLTNDIPENSALYVVDESKPDGEQVKIQKFLQGDWRTL